MHRWKMLFTLCIAEYGIEADAGGVTNNSTKVSCQLFILYDDDNAVED